MSGPPRLAIAGLALAVAASATSFAASGAGEARTSPPAAVKPAAQHGATVRIDLAHAGPRVPADFLGLSIEAHELPQFGRDAAQGNLAGLLRSLGPGVVRFGGDTSDNDTAWVDSATPRPSWAHATITAPDLNRIATLARESGWRVLLGVGLGHYDPARAAGEAGAARGLLGASLAAIEIGNEPDLYVVKRLRHRPWGFSKYRAQVRAYRQAIAAAYPSFPLAGPDLAQASRLDWLGAYASAEHPALETVHYYPLSRCHGGRSFIPQLFSGIHPGEEKVVRSLAALGRTHRVPVRLGETNDTACHGQPGVSDTYASSLWALDYIVRAMDAGIAGVNFHNLPANCRTYSVLCASSARDWKAGRLHPQPKWYALLLAHALTGSRPLRTVSPIANLVAAAFRAPGGRIQVVLIDEGSRAAAVSLGLPRAFRRGTVLRLTGRSLGAHTAALGGAAVARDGSWRPARVGGLGGRPGALRVTVGGYSAALVTVSR